MNYSERRDIAFTSKVQNEPSKSSSHSLDHLFKVQLEYLGWIFLNLTCFLQSITGNKLKWKILFFLFLIWSSHIKFLGFNWTMLFLHFLVQFREFFKLIEHFKSAKSGIYVYTIISGSSKLILWQQQNIFIHLRWIWVENVLGDGDVSIVIHVNINWNESKWN